MHTVKASYVNGFERYTQVNRRANHCAGCNYSGANSGANEKFEARAKYVRDYDHTRFGIVAEMCDKVSVVYAGEIVETGMVEDVFARENNHPYTEGLFKCLPRLDGDEKRLSPIEGFMVDSANLPKGCKFHERCSKAMDICSKEIPPVYRRGTHCISCFRYAQWGKGDGLGGKCVD